MPPLPRLASWLLQWSVPDRWAHSVVDDLEAAWHARVSSGERRWVAATWITVEAARVAGRFAIEGGVLAAGATGRDSREAIRALTRQPRFAAAAVATIALGSGLNIAAFTIVDRVVLTPLPYADPQRLVELRARGPAGKLDQAVSSIDVEVWRDALVPQLDVAAYQVESAQVNLGGDSIGPPMATAHVTPNLMKVLGMAPVAGRSFADGDGRMGQPAVAMIAEHLWRARFGSDPGIIGRPIVIGGREHTIVGVGAQGLEFPPGVGVWVARDTAGAHLRALKIEFASLRVLGRVTGAIALDRAMADLERLGAAAAAEAGRDQVPVLRPLHQALVGRAGSALQLGWVAVAFLFLIACANGASLLMARTSARDQELAVRASLGASRRALIRHVAVEGSVLAGIGSLFGMVLAVGLLKAFQFAEPPGMPRLAGIHLSESSLLFAMALGVAAAILLSVVPALGAGRIRATPVWPSGAARGGRPHRGGGVLVAAQLALCLVLLVGAGVTGWGVVRQVVRDSGFEADGALVVSVQPDPSGSRSTSAIYAPFLDRLAATPGVTAVAMTDHLPPQAAGQLASIALEGERAEAIATAAEVRVIGVTPHYFDVLQIPLVAGRPFTAAEVARNEAVVIIDAQVAARAGGHTALGRRLVHYGRVFEIVGIAASVRQGSLGEPMGPTLYRPLSSGVFAAGASTFLTELHIVMRTSGDPATVAAAVQAAAGAVPRVLRAVSMATLSERLWRSLASQRFVAIVFGILAVLGAALAALGVYSLVSYIVQLSESEIGVRLALGASRGKVIGLVLQRGLGVAIAGVAIGLLAAPAVVGAVASRVDGVAPAGPGMYAGIVSALLVVVGSACWLPAWRATRIDPVESLRKH